MYQYNLIFGRIDTFFLYRCNLKYLIDINTTIAIGVAGSNRILKVIIYYLCMVLGCNYEANYIQYLLIFHYLIRKDSYCCYCNIISP